MKRIVSIGNQNFADIRENNYFYLDKTLFIKEWWESGDNTTLITRPRRFGKTLNMNAGGVCKGGLGTNCFLYAKPV